LHTPALYARYLERQAQWRSDLAATLVRRSSMQELRAVVTAGVAFAALDAALREWVAADGKKHLGDLLDETFALAFPG
jgi:hypothetical protein